MVMYHSDPLLLQHMLYVIETKELKWIDRGDDFSYHVESSRCSHIPT